MFAFLINSQDNLEEEIANNKRLIEEYENKGDRQKLEETKKILNQLVERYQLEHSRTESELPQIFNTLRNGTDSYPKEKNNEFLPQNTKICKGRTLGEMNIDLLIIELI